MMPSRFGSQTFAKTGDRHEGIYHKNQRHGMGTYLWSNGDKYVGNWRHGKVCVLLFVASFAAFSLNVRCWFLRCTARGISCGIMAIATKVLTNFFYFLAIPFAAERMDECGVRV